MLQTEWCRSESMTLIFQMLNSLNLLWRCLRSIDFVYKETGVNRQLRAKDDDIVKSPNQVLIVTR